MKGIDIVFADLSIRAVLSARRALMHMTIAEATSKTAYGKGDTLGLDSNPELAIRCVISEFMSDTVLVTEEEEVRSAKPGGERRAPNVIFIADPTDRSKFLKLLLDALRTQPGYNVEGAFVGECLYDANRETLWRSTFSGHEANSPLSIAGPVSAITCVRSGKPFFSAIVNYLTDEIVVAGPMGVFRLPLPDYRDTGAVDRVTLETVVTEGSSILFPSARHACSTHTDHLRYVTYLGKAGYQENYEATRIHVGHDSGKLIHHNEPGGPSRVLYLSTLNNGHRPVGFVMSNGEKIGEFCHWLPFVTYGKSREGKAGLRAYELTVDRPWTKDGILMSTSPVYSVFQKAQDESGFVLDVPRLLHFPRPSHFRSTLVVTQADNQTLYEIMGRNKFREIFF